MRQTMFNSTLSQVLETDDTSVDGQLLRLELLAMNFSEALSLSPLFREMDRRIRREVDSTVRASELALASTGASVSGRRRATGLGAPSVPLERLWALAKRVNAWQLSRLEVDGDSRRLEVHEAVMRGALLRRTERFELEVNGVSREYLVSLSNPDFGRREVELKILTKDPVSSADARLATRSFTLSYYDFPLIDNIRLSNDQRFALVLIDFSTVGEGPVATLEAVVFPGAIATQREAPTLEAVIDNLGSR